MADVKRGDAPIVIEETVGKKAYCRCGLTANMPYCDGAHSREETGVTPTVLEITEPGKKAVCTCLRTCNDPWCDGSHSKSQ